MPGSLLSPDGLKHFRIELPECLHNLIAFLEHGIDGAVEDVTEELSLDRCLLCSGMSISTIILLHRWLVELIRTTKANPLHPCGQSAIIFFFDPHNFKMAKTASSSFKV